MAPSRLLLVTTVLCLIIPAKLAAQDVASMVARVEVDGQPMADVTFSVVTGGQIRRLATSGSSGLAVIEFGRVPIAAGTRMTAVAQSCGDRHDVVFARTAAALPVRDASCTRTNLGSIAWGRVDRLEVTLGDSPRLASRAAAAVVQAEYGFRAQAGPVVAFAGGEELDNIGTGFGGEVVLGYDAPSGLGIGLGLGLVRHSLQGSTSVDESLLRWAIVAEPRFTFYRPDRSVRPYVAGRAAWQSLDAAAGSGLSTETGWSFGLGAGVGAPLVHGLSLDFSAHAARLMVGAEAFGEDFDRSGMLYSVGAALRY
jgi:hypothetical protein